MLFFSAPSLMNTPENVHIYPVPPYSLLGPRPHKSILRLFLYGQISGAEIDLPAKHERPSENCTHWSRCFGRKRRLSSYLGGSWTLPRHAAEFLPDMFAVRPSRIVHEVLLYNQMFSHSGGIFHIISPQETGLYVKNTYRHKPPPRYLLYYGRHTLCSRPAN